VWSLESVDAAGTFVTESGGYAALAPVTAASDTATRQRATFTVVAGLADPACVTFRAADGRYLRHYELRLQLSPQDSTALFREDATFCPHPGATATSVTLQSHNYPVLVLRYRDGGFYIDGSDGSAAFARQSSFIVRKPWA
jgi:hypothetical protein